MIPPGSGRTGRAPGRPASTRGFGPAVRPTAAPSPRMLQSTPRRTKPACSRTGATGPTTTSARSRPDSIRSSPRSPASRANAGTVSTSAGDHVSSVFGGRRPGTGVRLHRDLHDKRLMWDAEAGPGLLDVDTACAGSGNSTSAIFARTPGGGASRGSGLSTRPTSCSRRSRTLPRRAGATWRGCGSTNGQRAPARLRLRVPTAVVGPDGSAPRRGGLIGRGRAWLSSACSDGRLPRCRHPNRRRSRRSRRARRR